MFPPLSRSHCTIGGADKLRHRGAAIRILMRASGRSIAEAAGDRPAYHVAKGYHGRDLFSKSRLGKQLSEL
jgi:hypothetical protein